MISWAIYRSFWLRLGLAGKLRSGRTRLERSGSIRKAASGKAGVMFYRIVWYAGLGFGRWG
jgi:hypothetical protein